MSERKNFGRVFSDLGHKEKLAITVLRGEADREPEAIQFECDTFSEDLMACGIKLLELGVKDVAMESTGVYWKPLHNVWSPMGINLTVGQAAHVKTVPGRKTDMNDSHWLAQLHRFGLVDACGDFFAALPRMGKCVRIAN